MNTLLIIIVSIIAVTLLFVVIPSILRKRNYNETFAILENAIKIRDIEKPDLKNKYGQENNLTEEQQDLRRMYEENFKYNKLIFNSGRFITYAITLLAGVLLPLIAGVAYMVGLFVGASIAFLYILYGND